MQLWDQFLSLLVWKEPVYIGQQALIQLPRLSPSLYELRLSRDCKEVSDFWDPSKIEKSNLQFAAFVVIPAQAGIQW